MEAGVKTWAKQRQHGRPSKPPVADCLPALGSASFAGGLTAACLGAAAVRNVWQFYLLRFLLGLAEGGARAIAF